MSTYYKPSVICLLLGLCISLPAFAQKFPVKTVQKRASAAAERGAVNAARTPTRAGARAAKALTAGSTSKNAAALLNDASLNSAIQEQIRRRAEEEYLKNPKTQLRYIWFTTPNDKYAALYPKQTVNKDLVRRFVKDVFALEEAQKNAGRNRFSAFFRSTIHSFNTSEEQRLWAERLQAKLQKAYDDATKQYLIKANTLNFSDPKFYEYLLSHLKAQLMPEFDALDETTQRIVVRYLQNKLHISPMRPAPAPAKKSAPVNKNPVSQNGAAAPKTPLPQTGAAPNAAPERKPDASQRPEPANTPPAPAPVREDAPPFGQIEPSPVVRVEVPAQIPPAREQKPGNTLLSFIEGDAPIAAAPMQAAYRQLNRALKQDQAYYTQDKPNPVNEARIEQFNAALKIDADARLEKLEYNGGASRPFSEGENPLWELENQRKQERMRDLISVQHQARAFRSNPAQFNKLAEDFIKQKEEASLAETDQQILRNMYALQGKILEKGPEWEVLQRRRSEYKKYSAIYERNREIRQDWTSSQVEIRNGKEYDKDALEKEEDEHLIRLIREINERESRLLHQPPVRQNGPEWDAYRRAVKEYGEAKRLYKKDLIDASAYRAFQEKYLEKFSQLVPLEQTAGRNAPPAPAQRPLTDMDNAQAREFINRVFSDIQSPYGRAIHHLANQFLKEAEKAPTPELRKAALKRLQEWSDEVRFHPAPAERKRAAPKKSPAPKPSPVVSAADSYYNFTNERISFETEAGQWLEKVGREQQPIYPAIP